MGRKKTIVLGHIGSSMMMFDLLTNPDLTIVFPDESQEDTTGYASHYIPMKEEKPIRDNIDKIPVPKKYQRNRFKK